jgi:hypothetical protein
METPIAIPPEVAVGTLYSWPIYPVAPALAIPLACSIRILDRGAGIAVKDSVDIPEAKAV